MIKKTVFPLFALLLALLLLIVIGWDPAAQSDYSQLAAEIGEAPQGGDFILQSANGPLSLESLRGKVVLLYFGYTLCPDICPTSLAMMSQGFAKMEPQELRQVQGVFVSVDPERDTLQHLETYGRYFHDNIRGVSGTPEEVAKVARMYGAAYRKVESDSAMGYIVDHSAYTYVIDQQGRLHGSLPHGTMPDVIVQTVRNLLGGKTEK